MLASVLMKYWKEINSEIFTYTYDLGGGPITSIAFKIDDTQIIVVSPPTRLPEEAYKEIESQGSILGLVAPNFNHYLGVKHWRQRFPNARLFASSQAQKRLLRKSNLDFEPITNLTPIIKKEIKTYEFPYIKSGEVLFFAKTDNGWCWYITDLLTNFSKLPGKAGLKILTFLLIAKTGLHVNRFNKNIFITDRYELKKWFLEKLKTTPPSLLITAHGELIGGENLINKITNVITKEY